MPDPLSTYVRPSPLRYGNAGYNAANVRPPGVDYHTMSVQQLRDLASRGDPQAKAVLDEARSAATRPPVPAEQSAQTAKRALIDEVGNLTTNRAVARGAVPPHIAQSEPLPTPEEADQIQPQTPVDKIMRALGIAGGKIGQAMPNLSSVPTYTPEAMRPQTQIDPAMHMGDYPPEAAPPAAQGPGPAPAAQLPPNYLRTSAQGPGPAPAPAMPIPKVTPPAAAPTQEKSITDKLFGPDSQEAWGDLLRFGLALMQAGEAKPGSTVGPSLFGALGEAGTKTIDYQAKRRAVRAKQAATSREKELDREVQRERNRATNELARQTAEYTQQWRKAQTDIDRAQLIQRSYEDERKEIEGISKNIMGLAPKPGQKLEDAIAEKEQQIHAKFDAIRRSLPGEGQLPAVPGPQDVSARYSAPQQHGPAMKITGPGWKNYYYMPKGQ